MVHPQPQPQRRLPALLLLLAVLLLTRADVVSASCKFSWNWELDCTSRGRVTSVVTLDVTSDEPEYEAAVVFHWGPGDTDLGPRTYPTGGEETVVEEWNDYDPDGGAEYYIGISVAFSDSECEGYGFRDYKLLTFEDGCDFLDFEGSNVPTRIDDAGPPTISPTDEPATPRPSKIPTDRPVATEDPTLGPTTTSPSARPSVAPTESTPPPSTNPTKNPTNEPTKNPTKNPTSNPSPRPTTTPPTKRPSVAPTESTSSPSEDPTNKPTREPTEKPTRRPTTASPSERASPAPTKSMPPPSTNPTNQPTRRPSPLPMTASPSDRPTAGPITIDATTSPPNENTTQRPTSAPIYEPLTTISPTRRPTSLPLASDAPTTRPAAPTPAPVVDSSPTTAAPALGGAVPDVKVPAGTTSAPPTLSPSNSSDRSPGMNGAKDGVVVVDPGDDDDDGGTRIFAIVAAMSGCVCVLLFAAVAGRRYYATRHKGSGGSEKTPEGKDSPPEAGPDVESNRDAPEQDRSRPTEAGSDFEGKGDAPNHPVSTIERKAGYADDVSTLGDPYMDAAAPGMDTDKTVGESMISTQQELYVYGVRRPQGMGAASGVGGSPERLKTSTIFGDDNTLENMYHQSQQQQSVPDFQLLTVVAPPGQLGIRFENSPGELPVVWGIKETSVLYGRVHVGDTLLSVDGVDCMGMSKHEVASFLSGRSQNPTRILALGRSVGSEVNGV